MNIITSGGDNNNNKTEKQIESYSREERSFA